MGTLQYTATHCNTIYRSLVVASRTQSTNERTLPATHCNTLQHTATHYITIHEILVMAYTYKEPEGEHTHCNTLQHTATHYNTLQHTATHCNTLQHTATQRMRFWFGHTLTKSTDESTHTATHCNTLQHTATHCNAIYGSLVLAYTYKEHG